LKKTVKGLIWKEVNTSVAGKKILNYSCMEQQNSKDFHPGKHTK